MSETDRVSILVIPAKREGSEAFRRRVKELIVNEGTHIYIDTSFLMWMTKVGSGSRGELTDWLQRNCVGRVHVPVWSAHEYLKHHISGTIVSEFTAKTKEVARFVRSTYFYLRPFIDETLEEGGENPARMRIEARETLNRLERLNQDVGKWPKSYGKHASEVISFINDHTPDDTQTYEDLDTIMQTGSGRYMGSVPPGYRDRWKEGREGQSKQASHGTSHGANQYGDLMFWKEALLHARRMSATALVVFTNDRKNDWFMGGGDLRGIEPELQRVKKDWKSVPEPHPMLVLEARLVAKVSRVEVLDSLYLAVLLQALAGQDVRAFVDVAMIPDGSDTEGEGDVEAQVSEADQEVDADAPLGELTDRPYLFRDSQKVLNTHDQFRSALLASRSNIDEESEKLLDSWCTVAQGELSFAETLSSGALRDFDQKMLARLARELHDRAQKGIPGYGEALVDLISNLDRLPPNTAGALYLGLLASMYLCRESNKSRIPPSSPAAELLFERQSQDYAINGVGVVAWRMSDNEEAPLYLPSSKLPSIKFTFAIDRNPNTPNQLSSLNFQQVELLTPAQNDVTLRLCAILGVQGQASGREIVRRACELFAIPFGQVEDTSGVLDQIFGLTDTVGFKRPTDIAIPKGQADGE